MAEQTPRMQWPYPTAEDDPWYDTFEDAMSAIDASGYAEREDRHAILGGGNVIAWSAGTSTLSWSGPIYLASPITGFLWQVPANSTTIAEGEVFYVTLNRGPGQNTNVAFGTGNTVPSTDEDYVLAIRIGSIIYWRNGLKMDDGDTLTNLGSGQGSGGGGASPRTARIIVGNSVNGDVAADADYLDIGDGVQLAAALAAASSGDDVFVRAGTYDLGAGAATPPLVIPAGVRVRGAGFGTKIVTKDSGNMGAFTLSNDASLVDIFIRVAVPTGAGTGATTLIGVSGDLCEVGNVYVDFQGSTYTGTEAGYLALTSVLQTAGGAAAPHIHDLRFIDVPATGSLGGSDLVLINQVSGFNLGRYSDLQLDGGDVSMHVRTPSVHANIFASGYSRGFRVSDLADKALFSNLEILVAAMAADYRGVIIEGAIAGASFSNVSIRSFIGAQAGSKGVLVDGTASRNLFSNVGILDMEGGIELAAGTSKNIVLGGSVDGATTPVLDSGSLNEVAHVVT